MILGAVCTRGCRFCDVTSGRPPLGPDPEEPQRLAEAAAAMALRYVVVTSVDRDDLDDQGAGHFVAVVEALRQRLPETLVELLTPDFQGQHALINLVGRSGADVLAHNVETVAALTPQVRDRRCSYDRSLAVLATYRALGPQILVKSSLMLGLGEQQADVLTTLREMRAVGVDWVTLGQYLRPSRKHLAVERFLHPHEFDELAVAAKEMGFALVHAGPLVRSSYRAAETGAQQILRERRLQAIPC